MGGKNGTRYIGSKANKESKRGSKRKNKVHERSARDIVVSDKLEKLGQRGRREGKKIKIKRAKVASEERRNATRHIRTTR